MKQKSNKEIYRELCAEEAGIPIFSKDWYLDAVCDETNWDVALVIKGGHVFGALPYLIKQKYGFTLMEMPKLTQTLGPWIKYPEGQKYETKLKHEYDILGQLISSLPKFSYFKQKFNYNYQNWLPFFWEGFTQTTNYTYVIEDTSDLDKIFKEFNGNLKRQIKKAEKIVEVKPSEEIETFYRINKMAFEKNKIKIPYSLEFLKNLDEVLKNNDARRILFATDENDSIHSVIYLIYDTNSVYYLMGGINDKYSSSGSQSLLMWEGIKFASQNGLSFDFEGSMIKPIEKFFRSFGAKQKPYFKISKTNSSILKIAQNIF